jgi:hypothetical protein
VEEQTARRIARLIPCSKEKGCIIQISSISIPKKKIVVDVLDLNLYYH